MREMTQNKIKGYYNMKKVITNGNTVSVSEKDSRKQGRGIGDILSATIKLTINRNYLILSW